MNSDQDNMESGKILRGPYERQRLFTSTRGSGFAKNFTDCVFVQQGKIYTKREFQTTDYYDNLPDDITTNYATL